MAESPPKKDQIWSYKNQRFRILGILENGDVNVEKINADNKSSKHLPISKLYWQKRDYELEYGSEESENSEEPEKSEESRKTAQGKSKEKLNPVFTFEYDANINKLVVKKNGAFVTDIPIATVAGQNGKNAYEEWVSRQPSKTKDEDKTLYIRIKSSAQLFELLIPPLIEYLKYYRSGIIDSYYVEEEKHKIVKQNNFYSVINIKKPTTILCDIDKEQTLMVYSSLTILGTLKGTLIIQNNKAVVIIKRMENAKVINCMGIFEKINGSNKILKGNESL